MLDVCLWKYKKVHKWWQGDEFVFVMGNKHYGLSVEISLNLEASSEYRMKILHTSKTTLNTLALLKLHISSLENRVDPDQIASGEAI